MPLRTSRSIRASRVAAPLLAAALLAGACPARAACCIFEDPLLAIGDVAARSGTVRLALESEVGSSGGAMEAHAGMTMEESVRLATVRLTAAYSPLERLSLVATVPIARRAWRAEGADMPAERTTLTGVGDVDVGARLALFRQVEFVPDYARIAVARVQAIAVAAGLGLPTGENGERREGARLEEHAQLGTGAWAPYAGLAWQLQREPWAASISATARVRSENAVGYRFGRALVAGADVQRDVGSRLSVGLGADVRVAAPDREHGAAVASTGGLVVSAAPSATFAVGHGTQLRVRGQVPVLERLRGDQRVGVGVVAGVLWAAR